jgi:hypothetical protein
MIEYSARAMLDCEGRGIPDSRFAGMTSI